MAFFANRFHFMENIVIIKTGAAGDVLRTTVLLHLFKGKNITWITAGHNHEVLPQEFPGLNILDLEMVNPSSIISDHTISLDDEIRCAGLATSIETKKITGTYSLRGDVQYTADSSEWFDMGLVSKLGKKIADDLKKEEQQILPGDSIQHVRKNIQGRGVYQPGRYCSRWKHRDDRVRIKGREKMAY